MRLFFSKDTYQKIIEHAKKEFPKEACGIIGGVENKGLNVFPLTNTDKSPISYFASPEEQFKVFKEIRKKGLSLVAIYHSHPHSKAKPSQKDVDLAFYPDAFYIIISLTNRALPDIKAFKINQKKVEEAEIIIKEEEDAYSNLY